MPHATCQIKQFSGNRGDEMDSRSIKVFIGPSLSVDKAQSLLHAEYLPPAVRGSIEALESADTSLVVLIDGAMVYDYPPSPQEVAACVARGIPVIGAASLGALRAAELRNLGVHGHGWVYEALLNQQLTADDELVARVNPNTFQPSTTFLVNIRYALSELVSVGEISSAAARDAMNILSAVPFEQRTPAWVREVALMHGIAHDLLSPKYDIKATDAASCLAYVSNIWSMHTVGTADVRSPFTASRSEATQRGDPVLPERRPYDETSALGKVIDRLDEFGITRLADTTGMDSIGIPTAAAVRPGTTDVIWVYSGKGETRDEARLVAIMECIERSTAVWDDSRVTYAAPTELERSGHEVWGLERFTEPKLTTISSDWPISWVTGASLQDGRTVYLPADLAFAGYRPTQTQGYNPFQVTTSNGLGAGFSSSQAIAHALAEIIERDVVSLYELRSSHGPGTMLLTIADHLEIDLNLDEFFRDDVNLAPTISIDSIPMSLHALVQRFLNAGLTPVIKALPNDFCLPAFGVATVEAMGFDSYLACAGFGLHANPVRALRAALLELAQTRATDLQGAREDRHHFSKRRWRRAPQHHWLATPGHKAVDWRMLFPAAKPHTPQTYLQALGRVGLPDAAVVSFHPTPDIYSVRVIVPGAETWHPTEGRASLGSRARKMLEKV